MRDPTGRIKIVDYNATDVVLSLDGEEFAIGSDTWDILGYLYEGFAGDKNQFYKALNVLMDYIHKNAPKEDKL